MAYLDDFSGSGQNTIITIYNDDSHVQTFTLENQENAVIYATMLNEEVLQLNAYSTGGSLVFGNLDTRVQGVTQEEFDEYYSGIITNQMTWSSQSYAPIEKVEISGTIPVVINVQDQLARNLVPASGLIVTNVPEMGWVSKNVFATALVKYYSKIVKIYHDIYIDVPETGNAFRPPFTIHTHHNIDFSNVETYIKFGIANHGVFDVFHYADGNFERLGTSQFDMGMLQDFTFENALSKGYANWKLGTKGRDDKRDAVAFHFQDAFVESASLQKYESDEVVILQDGTGSLIQTPAPNIYIICRIFYGRPPQEVIDNSDGGDNPDNEQYDGHSGDDDHDTDQTTDDIPNGSDEGSAGIFHDVYKVTDLNMKSLHNKLWTQSYYDVLKVNENPIDNVVSCKRFPFDMSGSSQEIRIGNIDTGVAGYKIGQGIRRFDAGGLTLNPHYKCFLDNSGYTNVSIFLPFVGYQPLPTSECMGKYISVWYLIDLVTGVCKAQVFINRELYTERDGQMGIDCTLTASTQKQSEIANATRYMNLAGDVVNVGANIAQGNVAGAVGGAIGGISSFMNSAPNNSFVSTSSNASISNAGKIKPFLIIDRPIPRTTGANYPSGAYPNDYKRTVGIPAGVTRQIKQLHGFVKCGGEINFEKDFICSDEIKNAIVSAMQKGFEI